MGNVVAKQLNVKQFIVVPRVIAPLGYAQISCISAGYAVNTLRLTLHIEVEPCMQYPMGRKTIRVITTKDSQYELYNG